jgi:hypothetical protein
MRVRFPSPAPTENSQLRPTLKLRSHPSPGVELRPESHDVNRLVVRADGIQSVLPGREQFAVSIEVAAGGLVLEGEVLIVAAHDIGGRPPHLVVSGSSHPAQVGSGERTAKRDVGMRSEPRCGWTAATYWTS